MAGLQVMSQLAERRLTRRRAAWLLGLSERQVRRLYRAFRRDGAKALASRRRGRPRARRRATRDRRGGPRARPSTPQHDARRTDVRALTYRWHPLYGREFVVRPYGRGEL